MRARTGAHRDDAASRMDLGVGREEPHVRWFIPLMPACLAFGPLFMVILQFDPEAPFLLRIAPMLVSLGLSLSLIMMFIIITQQQRRLRALEERLEEANPKE